MYFLLYVLLVAVKPVTLALALVIGATVTAITAAAAASDMVEAVAVVV